MLTIGIVRGEVNRQWRPLVAPMLLIRPDRARPIDRVIDYFGGGEQRRAPVSPWHKRHGPPTHEQHAVKGGVNVQKHA